MHHPVMRDIHGYVYTRPMFQGIKEESLDGYDRLHGLVGHDT